MAKDNKVLRPQPSVPENPFSKFVRENLDRVIEERVDVQDTATTVRNEVIADRAKVDEAGNRTTEAPPVRAVPSDPVTMEVMQRRYLPAAYLTGSQVAPVDIVPGASEVLVEAYQLLSDLTAGGMIIMSSPLIWSRVSDTTTRLRAAITTPAVVTEPVQ